MRIKLEKLKQGLTFLYCDELYIVTMFKEHVKEVLTIRLNDGYIATFPYYIKVEPVNIEIKITKVEAEMPKVFGI